MEPILETDAGPVRGAREEGPAAFRGIPCAGSLLGALRFEPPCGPRRWDGVRDATRFGPAPPQVAEAWAERLSFLGDWMDAWLAFARDGDPAHAGIGRWPRYTEESRTPMVFGEKSGALDAPFEAERAVWDAPGRPGA